MKVDEKIILLQLKEGKNDAYKYIYDHYYTLLCNIAFEYVKEREPAQSIVDELIFHIWDNRMTLDITTSLKSYLVRSVRNRSINYLTSKRNKVELHFSSLNLQNDIDDIYSDGINYPLAKLMEKELEEKINNAIEQLPEECKVVFKMSRFEDKKYEQIAQELSISINTVKYHMKNALSILYSELRKYLVLLLFF